jgi:hypothetical protein
VDAQGRWQRAGCQAGAGRGNGMVGWGGEEICAAAPPASAWFPHQASPPHAGHAPPAVRPACTPGAPSAPYAVRVPPGPRAPLVRDPVRGARTKGRRSRSVSLHPITTPPKKASKKALMGPPVPPIQPPHRTSDQQALHSGRARHAPRCLPFHRWITALALLPSWVGSRRRR